MGIIHLWSVDADPSEHTSLAPMRQAQESGSYSVMHLVQAIVQAGWRDLPRLYLVTKRAQRVGRETTSLTLAAAPLWGLGRCISHEHSDLRCTMIDIGDAGARDEMVSLFNEISADDAEDQIALRGGERFVARFARFLDADAETEPRTDAGYVVEDASPELVFQLDTSKPGVLENLVLRRHVRRPPGRGEVEIRVAAAGLNFRDVMKAMGLYPGIDDGIQWFGDECSGEIVAIGEGVADFKVGDRVVAVAAASLSAYVTTSALFVAQQPGDIDFHQAATIPIAFLTAYYCLIHLARLARGERVLIHAASGGVGLAAVQLAQHIGAEVFATAGSPEKRAMLQAIGVQHVADSRSLAFAEEIMRATGGEGVDVVLNSLTGEAIPKSIALLRAYGRFLEIGKRDIYEDSKIGLLPFQNNLSFHAVDMDRLFREREQFSGGLMREVFALVRSGAIKPLPLTRFAIAEAAEAFKFMAEARHTGKIVLSFRPPQKLRIVPARETSQLFRDDRSYLITGGLGDLGLKLAGWMVTQGARHLVLMGRSVPTSAARDEIERLEIAGARVHVVQADVAEEDQVRHCFEHIKRATFPLGGIVHAAATFDDAFLRNYSSDRFRKVIAPKMDGAWNLHTLSAGQPLDFFVLFSSVAAVFGSAGQGSYCAANAFLDALAQHRRNMGLPALSINWGPWAEVRRAAAEDGGENKFRGIASMPPEKALAAFGQLLRRQPRQISVVPVDVRRWRQVNPRAAESPLLEGLEDDWNDALRSANSAVRRALAALGSGTQRRAFLESHLIDEVTGLLRIARSAVDRHTSLSSLGFGSLVAFELRNRLEDSLGVSLSATLVWGGHANIAELADYLAKKMGIATEPEPLPGSEHEEPDADDNLSKMLGELEQLSDDEVDRLLANAGSNSTAIEK
jgi:NADPH:quinone reductase-like Zn-dependent oxidoreductase/acyl carrier protein